MGRQVANCVRACVAVLAVALAAVLAVDWIVDRVADWRLDWLVGWVAETGRCSTSATGSGFRSGQLRFARVLRGCSV